MYGAKPVECVNYERSSQIYPKIRSHALPKRHLEKIRNKSRHCRVKKGDSRFSIRCFNVLDPLDHSNNVARAVSRQVAPQISLGLKNAKDHFTAVTADLFELYNMSLSYMVSDTSVHIQEEKCVSVFQHFFQK